jgi:hypothetical protein
MLFILRAARFLLALAALARILLVISNSPLAGLLMIFVGRYLYRLSGSDINVALHHAPFRAHPDYKSLRLYRL